MTSHLNEVSVNLPTMNIEKHYLKQFSHTEYFRYANKFSRQWGRQATILNPVTDSSLALKQSYI
jgi:hypothetical protein